jgi:hypothetical protein
MINKHIGDIHMANRTVQIFGSGYGSSAASVTATWAGSQVFSGTVPTQIGPVPALPNLELSPGEVLFTLEIPMDQAGNISMTTSVTDNPVLFTVIQANYANIANVVGNVITYVSSGPTGFENISGRLNVSDTRSEVSIDSVIQSIPDPKPESETGTWWWVVPAGSTLSCQVDVQAGLE